MKKDRNSIKEKLNTEDVSSLIFGDAPSTPRLKEDKRSVGRPTIPKDEALAELHTDVPTEEAYLNAEDMYLPYSTNIRADLYLRLKRLEHHKKQSVRSMLEDIIEEFVDKEPLANKPLPEKKVKKLKMLRSPVEYYHLRKTE